MNYFLILTFLFTIGSLFGWLIELVFRKFFAKDNPEHKWINPGFLVGPCLPLYGFSLCTLYLLAHIDVSFISNVILQKIVLFFLMALAVTLIEFIAGLIFIKGMKVKLWDYSHIWGNLQGIICPLFSFFWLILCIIYYFLIHPYIISVLSWFSGHLAYSFVIGFFYGVLFIDFTYSMNVLTKIRKFAADKQIIVRYEALKDSIRLKKLELQEKHKFIFALYTEGATLADNLKQYLEKEQEKIKKLTEITTKQIASKILKKNNKDDSC